MFSLDKLLFPRMLKEVEMDYVFIWIVGSEYHLSTGMALAKTWRSYR